MIRLLIFMSLFLPVVNGTASPYQVESQVREDLEDLLGSIILKEQFLVQVRTQVTTEVHRKLVEGETIQDTPSFQEPEEPAEALPGFIPQVREKVRKPKPSKKTRERYTTYEKPKLEFLRATVNFDSALPTPAVRNAQKLVRNYLRSNFPQISRVTFNEIPMLKPPEPKPKEVAPPKPPEPKIKEPTFEEQMLRWLPWMALLLTILLLFLSNRKPAPAVQPQAQAPMAWPPYMPSNFGRGEEESSRASEAVDEDVQIRNLRTRLFNKVVASSDAFRQYYKKLEAEQQEELEGILRGPAFDNFMDGLELDRAANDTPISDPVERTIYHEGQFDEFVQTSHWRQRQFFGFLNQLTNEQLVSLSGFESDENVCLILRFLRPDQSAYILDNLPEERRPAILSHMARVHSMSLAEVGTVEKKVRAAVQRLPAHMLGGGGAQEVTFWGSVLDESTRSTHLLQELEQTNPNISPHLQKYRFSLDDAASLPDEYLRRVIGEADNEELCLALTTCSERTVEIILDALPEKRRNLVKQLMIQYQNASPEAANKARTTLTRRIREAMADAA